MSRYDAVVYIGRFQPFHRGHEAVVHQALAAGRRLVIVLGSAFQAPTAKNPWRHDEREAMIRTALPAAYQSRITFVPVADTGDDPGWAALVRRKVRQTLARNDRRVALIGFEKDDSSYYLKLFPQWDRIEVGDHEGISATPIRARMMNHTNPLDALRVSQELSERVRDWLSRHITRARERYSVIREDEEYVTTYRASWHPAPFAPTLTTTDMAVIAGRHILLVKRRGRPGKGLMALPGGFLEQDDTLWENALRELKEETGLRLDKKRLAGAKIASFFMDAPKRSRLGRSVTCAFACRLSWRRAGVRRLPVTGGDDAEKAAWVRLDQIDPYEMFEDHFEIIDRAVARVGGLGARLAWWRACRHVDILKNNCPAG